MNWPRQPAPHSGSRRATHRAALHVAILVLAAGLLAACQGGATNASGASAVGSGAASTGTRITVVTTSTVFADLVRQVGGNRVDVTSLVPRGVDPHTFEPRPSDAARLAAARLIVMNGLGLDDWLTKLIETSGSGGTVLRLGEGLTGVDYIVDGTTGTPNPHLWMDVSLAIRYVGRITDALSAVDPGGASAYRAGGAAYTQRLTALDSWIRSQVAGVPSANRKLVLFHDAFPYYARAYGLTVVGSIVDAPGQDPSAGRVAALIDAIKAAGVRAIFSEVQFPPNLVQQIASETGASVVSDLYDDALGDPPLDTYEAIMRYDTQQIVAALR